jgi:hypothetical protein
VPQPGKHIRPAPAPVVFLALHGVPFLRGCLPT